MNKPKSNKAWRIGWPIIAIGWLVLSVLEFIDDEGRIFKRTQEIQEGGIIIYKAKKEYDAENSRSDGYKPVKFPIMF